MSLPGALQFGKQKDEGSKDIPAGLKTLLIWRQTYTKWLTFSLFSPFGICDNAGLGNPWVKEYDFPWVVFLLATVALKKMPGDLKEEKAFRQSSVRGKKKELQTKCPKSWGYSQLCHLRLRWLWASDFTAVDFSFLIWGKRSWNEIQSSQRMSHRTPVPHKVNRHYKKNLTVSEVK